MTDEREEALRLAKEVGFEFGPLYTPMDTQVSTEMFVKFYRLARAQPQGEPGSLPLDWNLMPVRPDENMMQAVHDGPMGGLGEVLDDRYRGFLREVYAAFLDNAPRSPRIPIPSPPAQAVPEGWSDLVNDLLHYFENPPHEFSAEQEDRLISRLHGALSAAPKPGREVR